LTLHLARVHGLVLVLEIFILPGWLTLHLARVHGLVLVLVLILPEVTRLASGIMPHPFHASIIPIPAGSKL
jgi:hypothetical protein